MPDLAEVKVTTSCKLFTYGVWKKYISREDFKNKPVFDTCCT